MAATHTDIYATADGVVGRSAWAGGYGNLIEIDHGKGIQTRYGHLSRSLVTAGQRVKRGDLTEAEGAELVELYESKIDAYTYLSVNGKKEKG